MTRQELAAKYAAPRASELTFITKAKLEELRANAHAEFLADLEQMLEEERFKKMDITNIPDGTDLNTLKHVQFMFSIHSDASPFCNGFRSLCDLIEKIERDEAGQTQK